MSRFSFIGFLSLSFITYILPAEEQYKNNILIKDNSPVSLLYFDTITQVSAQTSHNIPLNIALEHQQDICKRNLPLSVEIMPPFKDSPNGLLCNHALTAPKESLIASLLYKKAQEVNLQYPYPSGSFIQKGFIYKSFWWNIQCDQDDKRLKKLWNFMEAIDRSIDLNTLQEVCINGIDNPDYNFFDAESADDWTHNQMRNRRIHLLGDYLLQYKNLSLQQVFLCLPALKQIPRPLPKM